MALPPADTIKWRNAQDWLFSTGMLPTKYRELLEFALSLRDGVVLCEVANFLQPDAVKRIADKPTIQFMCMSNINMFLTACIQKFGFEPHELFTATELLETGNFNKVVDTLSKLSHTIHARKRGLIPFTVASDTLDNDFSFYDTLETMADSYREEIYSRIYDCPDNNTIANDFQMPNESIYEDLVTIKEFRLEAPSDKRGYLLDEIFETEKNYVQVLEAIITHYKKPLSVILREVDTSVIFNNIEELMKIHERLLQRVKLSLDNGGKTIGECFKRTEDQFYKYGPYCANLPEASKRIDELLARDTKLAATLERCAKDSGQRFPLKDLLKVPAQRILKYHLLLDNLVKYTPDQPGLKEGLSIMRDIAMYINEYKRDFEAKYAIENIIERIVDIQGHDLASFGKLLRDGEVQLKMAKRETKRFLFLFEQAILICKIRDHSSLEIQALLDFESYDLSNPLIHGTAKFSSGWIMKPKFADQNLVPYQIMVKTSDQLDAWICKIQEGLLTVTPHQSSQSPHKLILKSFTELERCGGCNKVLPGVFMQGYHCPDCMVKCHRNCTYRLSDCKNFRVNRVNSFAAKELPKIPSTPPPPHSPGGDLPVSPPPIPPRAPSQKRRSIISLNSQTSITPRSPASDDLGIGRLGVQGDIYVCHRDFMGYTAPGFEPTIVLKKGELVEIIEKQHPAYWKGKSQSSGSIGYFPAEHVALYGQAQEIVSHHTLFQQPNDLFKYIWYIGPMDRPGGKNMLEAANVPDGCYLVRESHNRIGQYCIDVKYNFAVKHIKVVHSDTEGGSCFCLTPSKTFHSIVELVTYYQYNSLGSVFKDLQTNLTIAYRSLPV